MNSRVSQSNWIHKNKQTNNSGVERVRKEKNRTEQNSADNNKHES